MKVVIDTNILIGGAYDEHSYSWKIIREVIEGRLEAYATHKTMRENRLLLKQAVKDHEYQELLEEFFRKLKIVRRFKKLNVVSDPEDNKLFESAAAAEADYLITSDREVLAVEEYQSTKVVNPDEFWAIYQKEKEDGNRDWDEWAKMVMGD